MHVDSNFAKLGQPQLAIFGKGSGIAMCHVWLETKLWESHTIIILVFLYLWITSFSPKKIDRKSTRLNSSHVSISYVVFCLNKKALEINDELKREYADVVIVGSDARALGGWYDYRER